MPSGESPRLRAGKIGAVAVGLCVVGLVGLVGIVLLGRIDRAPSVWLTGLLFVLPHLFAVYVVGVFGLWCVVPDRRALPGLLTIAVVVGVLLWGPSMASHAPAHEHGMPVRVMSWNVQRLWGGPGEQLAPSCVAETIRAVDPDVLVLLEISREDLEQLSVDLGLDCAHGTYNANGTTKQGGLAVCSGGDWVLQSGGPQRFVDGEDWHYVRGELSRDTYVVNLLAVHLWPYKIGLDLSSTARVATGQANQSAGLLEHVGRFEDPTVVAGDFNSTRDFYLHSALRAHLQDTWELGGLGMGATKWVADWLPLRIDYIYASPSIAVSASEVPAVDCSDHRPVVSDLFLPPR